MDCDFGHGLLLFSIIKQVSENLGFFLLFTIGFKLLTTIWAQTMWDLRGKTRRLKSGFRSKFVLCGKFGLDEPLIGKPKKIKGKTNIRAVSDKESSTDADEVDFNHGNDCDEKDLSVEDSVFDVEALRNLVKIERCRANAALVELEKERAASATAAEETMAMITRLQNEKSKVQMELRQYRRLAEEKQIHDREVIESLQWVVLRHESEMGDQLKSCKGRLSKIDETEEVEEGLSLFNGNILDALENVLYSSRDVYMSPE